MKSTSPGARIERLSDRIFDAIGMRPLGMCVFFASIAVLWQLIVLPDGSLTVDAIAIAARTDHPSLTQSYVTEVYVRAGDRVDVGKPLVQLSPHFIDQRLARLELQIMELEGEAQLAQAKLRVREERWIEPTLRSRPSAPSLEEPTLAHYERQIEVERGRHEALLLDREALTVRSRRAGLVGDVLSVGAAVEEGTSVVSVLPEFAEEIVAYMPPETVPGDLSRDVIAYLREVSGEGCRAPVYAMRRGATVEQAPFQLRQLFRFPVIGLPLHLSIPENCRLGVGQVVSLEILFEARG